MARQIKSAEDLREYLQDKVNQIHEIQADKARVNPGLPTWHEPDENGCNWNCDFLSGDQPSLYAPFVRSVVIEAQRHFNLPDPDL